jgi:probable DNA repair protein
MSDSWIKEVLQGAVLVSVNQRLSRHHMQRYQNEQLAQGQQWWETPQILPWSSWLETLHRDCVKFGLSQKTLLPEIAEERVWRSALLKDKRTSLLLDIDATALSARQAWRVLNTWDCTGVNVSDKTAAEDHAAFARWCTQYQSFCQDNAIIDRATLTDHLIDILRDQPALIHLPKRLLLAGFLVVPKQMQRMLDVLTELGVQIDIVTPQLQSQQASSVQANVQRVVHSDDAHALQAIAAEAHQVLGNDASVKLGIVVHDLHQRRSEILRAFDAVFFPAHSPEAIGAIGRPYDLSLGLPLNEQSVVRTGLLLLKLCVNELNDTELSAFLLSSYLPGDAVDLRNRESLDRKFREQRRRKLTLFELITLLPKPDPLRSALQRVSKLKWKKKAASSVRAEQFGAMLNAANWPGESLNSEEYQTVEAWRACMDDLQILDDGELLTASAALTLLNRLCAKRLFQLETPSTPIQIMGRLESHGLEFDTLWVTGMDSEQWPPISTPTSFIPIQQQVAVGVPESSASIRLAVAESEYALWQRSAKSLLVCHVMSRDGLEIEPASIVADVPVRQETTVAPALLANYEKIMISAELEHINDTHGPELAPGTQVRGGARLLENQARCPFKAFSLHRLHIKPLEEAGIGLDPRQHGTLLHGAIELFWQRVKTHTALTAMDEPTLNATIADVIAESIKKYETPAALVDLQSRYLNRLLHDWIHQCEIPRAPFEVVSTEEEREVEIAGVQVKLFVDRIDKLETGHTIVVDYKTGQNNSVASWAEPRIESPQLPLYANTEEHIDGVCFAQVFTHKYKYIGIAAEADLVPGVGTKQARTRSNTAEPIDSWDDWLEHWQSALNTVATEIQQGVATITPTKKACMHCELPSLCRIDSSVIDAAEYAELEDQQSAINGGAQS